MYSEEGGLLLSPLSITTKSGRERETALQRKPIDAGARKRSESLRQPSMVKDLPRKCSGCGHNGHNSRTCSGNGKPCVKLFGVNISETKVSQSIKKSFSMGNLKAGVDEDHEENAGNVNGDVAGDDSGYLSDGLIHNKRRKDAHERKKGIPWSEEEHRKFLAGLRRLGKGNWREIARTFVTTRTPTQVASHAQKYFLRQAANDKKKRRSSLFDMHLKEPEAARKVFTVSIAAKIPGISSEEKAPISPTLARKKTTDSQQQVNAAKLVNRFPHLRLDSSPVLPAGPTTACCLPYYHHLPYLVGVPANVSFIPVMNFGRQDLITTCEPVIGHSSGIPSSPNAFPHMTKTPDPEQSEKDGLELKIGQPQISGSIIRVT